MTGYPRGFVTTLWVVFVLLVVSGVLLLPAAFERRWEWGFPWRLPTGTGVAVAAMHGVCASVFALIFGALWIVHMRSGWRKRKHLRSGLAIAISLGALIVTGWGIYYGGERSGAWTSAAHIVIGILVPATLGIHVWSGWRDPN